MVDREITPLSPAFGSRWPGNSAPVPKGVLFSGRRGLLAKPKSPGWPANNAPWENRALIQRFAAVTRLQLLSGVLFSGQLELLGFRKSSGRPGNNAPLDGCYFLTKTVEVVLFPGLPFSSEMDQREKECYIVQTTRLDGGIFIGPIGPGALSLGVRAPSPTFYATHINTASSHFAFSAFWLFWRHISGYGGIFLV